MDIIIFIIIGAIAGFLAGMIVNKESSLSVFDVIIGIVGALVGGWLAGVLGFGGYGLIGSIITATLGAVLVLFIYNAIVSNRR